MRFHFIWKSHFGVQSALYLCSYKLRLNETQNGIDDISVIFTKMKFQTGIRFSCEHDLPETKWISADSLDVAFNAHLRLKLNAGMDFISVILTEMKFHFGWYHVNTTRNEIPTPKWNTCTEMKYLHMSIKISGRFKMHPKWNFMWTELVFTLVWNLKPVWVHFVFHVNALLKNCNKSKSDEMIG